MRLCLTLLRTTSKSVQKKKNKRYSICQATKLVFTTSYVFIIWEWILAGNVFAKDLFFRSRVQMLNRLTKSAEMQVQLDEEYFKINIEGHQMRLKLENTLKNCHQVGKKTYFPLHNCSSDPEMGLLWTVNSVYQNLFSEPASFWVQRLFHKHNASFNFF